MPPPARPVARPCRPHAWRYAGSRRNSHRHREISSNCDAERILAASAPSGPTRFFGCPLVGSQRHLQMPSGGARSPTPLAAEIEAPARPPVLARTLRPRHGRRIGPARLRNRQPAGFAGTAARKGPVAGRGQMGPVRLGDLPGAPLSPQLPAQLARPLPNLTEAARQRPRYFPHRRLPNRPHFRRFGRNLARPDPIRLDLPQISLPCRRARLSTGAGGMR